MAVEARRGRGQPPSEEVEPPGQGDRIEAAEFIGSSVGELAQLARRHSLETLAYLLDMARLEADEIVRHRHGRRT